MKQKIRLLAFIVTIMMMFTVFSSCKAQEENELNTTQETEELNILTWANYIPNEVIDQFMKETGIRVNYSTMDTNEEMLDKLTMQKGQYDIIVCSDYIIDVMIKQTGLLQKLDRSRIANFKNINPTLQGLYFDPNSEYSIPHAFGCDIIVYDTAKVDFEIKSYADLWNPALENKIVVLDGARDVIGIALRTMGKSINETDSAVLNEAKEKLFDLKPNIIGFDANTPYTAIIRGDAVVGCMFGSQVTEVLKAIETAVYVYPEEGTSYALDNYVMADGAPNEANAYKFLDFVLQGEVSAKISSIINYANCNIAANEFLPQEYLDNKTVNIPAAELEKAQIYKDVGDANILYDEIWTEFKLR